MKKFFMISIMVFMSVAMFGQDRTKIAKETIMEKLSEWSSPTNENYHKLKALGINADSLAYVKIEKISTTPKYTIIYDKFIDNQKDTVIVKHYSVLGKEKTDTVNAVVCNGIKYDGNGKYSIYTYDTQKTMFSISNHYIEIYVIFDAFEYDVVGIIMKVYEYVSEYFDEWHKEYKTTVDLVSTVREFDNRYIKTEKFCEIFNERPVERKKITFDAPHFSTVKNDVEIKDNEKKTKRSDNRVDDVY